jgi:hypothetical protein
MPKQDFESRYQVIVRVALLTCSMSFEVITVRDVLFQIDVAKSVMATSRQSQMIELQGVQIHRLVEKYSELGWVKFFKSEGSKRKKFAFKLTKEGIFGIIHSLINIDCILSVPETVFCQWFLKTYQDLLVPEKNLHTSIQTIKSLRELIQNQALIHKQMAHLNHEITEVKQKIRESQAMQAKINRDIAAGADFVTAAQNLNYSYSYGQANQRPYAELIASLPEDLRNIELNRALPSREQHLYRFNLLYLEQTQEFYRTLLKGDLS